MPIQPVPPGFHTVTPYFIVEGADKFMAFVKSAFNATETFVMRAPDGTVAHGQLRIGDSNIMFAEATAAYKAVRPMTYLYVPDCDAVHAAAVAAGGTSVQAPTNQFYGDRSGAVTDPCGNEWWIATHVEEVSHDELARRKQDALSKKPE